MMVVTTPTGQIGSQVVQSLLAANEAVRVIARDPSRLPADIHARVEIVQGSSDDQGVLMCALKGAESLFLVVPPSFTTNDAMDYYLQFPRVPRHPEPGSEARRGGFCRRTPSRTPCRRSDSVISQGYGDRAHGCGLPRPLVPWFHGE